jgi:phosphoribosylanthranilate isomerase
MTPTQGVTPAHSPKKMDESIAVKICGIGSPADYDVCKDVAAAFVGMVFYPRSPRHLDLDAARALADHAEQAGAGPSRVALTVDMDDDGLADVIGAARPHYIQLHGHETPEHASRIRDRFGLPLIRAIRVAGPEDLEICKAWEGLAEWLLFDAKGDPGGLPGGTGHVFDWTLLANHAGTTRWMLAGGLSQDNVARAIAVTGASAVDVSSGVESAAGKKDADRIRNFVSKAQLG